MQGPSVAARNKTRRNVCKLNFHEAEQKYTLLFALHYYRMSKGFLKFLKSPGVGVEAA